MYRAVAGVIMSLALFSFLSFRAFAADGEAPPGDFYNNQTLKIIVATGSGGGYDVYARLFARYARSHFPGSVNIVVQNMPGASGIKAVNFLYTAVPNDGLTIATFNNAMPVYQILGNTGINFDVRNLSYIGSMSQVSIVLGVWHQAGITSINEAMNREVVLGATGTNGGMTLYPKLMNQLLGTKFKIVNGYEGGQSVGLALERGEIQGYANPWPSWQTGHPDWLKDHKVDFLVQVGPTKNNALPNAPLMTELARNIEQRKIIELITSNIAIERPYAGPPKLLPERLSTLRAVFNATMADAGFKADAEKQRLDISPKKGEEVAEIVNSIVGAPPEIIEKARALLLDSKDSLP